MANQLCDQLRSTPSATARDLAEQLADLLPGAFTEAGSCAVQQTGRRRGRPRTKPPSHHAIEHPDAEGNIRLATTSWPAATAVPAEPGMSSWQEAWPRVQAV